MTIIRTRRHKLAVAFAALVLAGGAAFGAVGAPAPAEAAGRCVDYNYSYGGYSSCVGPIQQLLNYKSHVGFAPLAVDNAFGPKTRDAVIKVQRAWGLQADGIVGPRTWSLICYPQKGPGPIPGFPYAAARAAASAFYALAAAGPPVATHAPTGRSAMSSSVSSRPTTTRPRAW